MPATRWLVHRPRISFKIKCVGFVDILALLSHKTIRESKSSTSGATMLVARRWEKLRYTTLQSSIHPQPTPAWHPKPVGHERKSKPDG
jgi:hypothetical protein